MSSVSKKIKKQISVAQGFSIKKGAPTKPADEIKAILATENNTFPGERDRLLLKLLDNVISHMKLSKEISAMLNAFIDCDKKERATDEQKLKQTNQGLQITKDELFDTQKQLQISQKENTQLKENLQEKQEELQMLQDELNDTKALLKQAQEENAKLEQQLQATQDDLEHIGERTMLQAEFENVEREIARYEEKIKRNPEKRKFYESQLAGYKKAREQYLTQLKELGVNFNLDSSFKLPDEESEKIFLEQMNQRNPTDEVILRSYEDEFRLLNIWNASDYATGVPDDLTRDGTLSLEDFIITFEPENFSARVVFSFDNNYSLGAIIFTDSPKTTLCVFLITGKDDNLILTSHEQNVEREDIFLSRAYRVLYAWYGIETALLNPVVKERIIGNRPVESVDTEHQYREDNKVAYIKRVPITVDDLLGDVDPKSFERHADKWSVAGHWRQYASGKKVWVKPHEKGPKRGQKLENQELRERVIVTDAG